MNELDFCAVEMAYNNLKECEKIIEKRGVDKELFKWVKYAIEAIDTIFKRKAYRDGLPGLEEMLDMQLNQREDVGNGFLTLIRVPGGWVYAVGSDARPVFVPEPKKNDYTVQYRIGDLFGDKEDVYRKVGLKSPDDKHKPDKSREMILSHVKKMINRWVDEWAEAGNLSKLKLADKSLDYLNLIISDLREIKELLEEAEG